jgi:hypothetical protein
MCEGDQLVQMGSLVVSGQDLSVCRCHCPIYEAAPVYMFLMYAKQVIKLIASSLCPTPDSVIDVTFRSVAATQGVWTCPDCTHENVMQETVALGEVLVCARCGTQCAPKEPKE